MTTLSKDHRTLLLEVVQRRIGERHDLVEAVSTGEMTAAQRSELCEVLGAEFAECGLGDDSEPTGYGLEVERVLDAVNRPNLHR